MTLDLAALYPKQREPFEIEQLANLVQLAHVSRLAPPDAHQHHHVRLGFRAR